MIKKIALAVALTVASSPACKAPTASVYGWGGRKCSEYILAIDHKDVSATNWLAGYLTAFNMWAYMIPLEPETRSFEEIKGWLYSVCKSSQNFDVSDGMRAVMMAYPGRLDAVLAALGRNQH